MKLSNSKKLENFHTSQQNKRVKIIPWFTNGQFGATPKPAIKK